MTEPLIIFLDVDGVLVVSRSLLGADNNDDPSLLFHPENEFLIPIELSMATNLVELVKRTNAKIVVSSTWRLDLEQFDWLQLALRKCGLPDGAILGKTKNILNSTRGEEIRIWLMENKHSNYVILEDSVAHIASFHVSGLGTNVVQTYLNNPDHEEGLTQTLAAAAEVILMKLQ
jgi:hypothetical protein